MEKWTDVVRFHVGDSATFMNMVHWDETAPDTLGDREGPWTNEEVKKREWPCWRHGRGEFRIWALSTMETISLIRGKVAGSVLNNPFVMHA